MATFAELRERLSLDGKQFERVCKWFLETDPRYSDRLVNVWLWDDWPGRWGPDCGIDLVAEDRDGRTWAIQAKCYDPKYSVTRNDMDRFLTESIHKDINHRLLIATTNKVGTNARKAIRNQNTVIPVSQLLLHDLETAPVVWPSDPARLRGGGPSKPVKRWPHQTQAINNVTKNLDKRGQMVMACGTGKTLAALWISERLEAKRTLVLLPSLTLLSQTVSEWLINAKEPFAYLPVCSDDTVSRGNDSAVMFTSDLEYPVTTDPDDIATFLRRRGRQVVFSTYQSSHQIAEAQTRNSVPGFDLVIADEAHRCAGKVSSVYGTVLDDEAIRAKKRLFMTATPRTYTARVQNKAREADIEIASMDDETVFGPVVHQLNFGEAIEKELLSDYQVVVVGVDNSRYKQMVDKRLIVKADKSINTDAETLAKHVALAKAIRDYDLHRTITFHSRIKTASEFANMLPKVVSWMPPRHRPKVEIVTDHVSGKMSTGERNRRLNRLRNIESGQSAVLTNAQCLSEGIDVPTLDGVAFIDPRRSEVDIVQAVGRAIRLSPDKTVGTIVIPVFLSGTDDPDTALSQSEFEPVWSIVRALRSHDGRLGEALDGIRLDMGRKGGGGRPPPPIVFDLPKSVSVKFVEAFSTRLVERTTSSWEFQFGRLLEFVAREGHTRVPRDWDDGNKSTLGEWVVSQRGQKNRETLLPHREQALDEIGMVWDPYESDFQEMLKAARTFIEREGDLRSARGHVVELDDQSADLGGWVIHQRSLRSAGTLLPHREQALDEIGMDWDPRETDLQETYEALKQFVEEHGHALVPQAHVEEVEGTEFPLGLRVSSLRARGRSTPPSTWDEAFEELPGWLWDTTSVEWDFGLEVLLAFVEEHGHARVPGDVGVDVSGPNFSLLKHYSKGTKNAGPDFSLGSWCKTRRMEYRKGILSEERVAVLEALLYWEWDPLKSRHNRRLTALRDFGAEHGHCRVPDDWVVEVDGETIDNLHNFVGNFQSRKRTGKGIEPAVEKELDSIPAWDWSSARDAKFWAYLPALRQYLERRRFSVIDTSHVEPLGAKSIPLGSWVSGLRSRHTTTNNVPDWQVVELESIPGWDWNGRHARFQRNLEALRQFCAEHGTRKIPLGEEVTFYEFEIKLWVWVNNMRARDRKGDLPSREAAEIEVILGPGWERLPGGHGTRGGA